MEVLLTQGRGSPPADGLRTRTLADASGTYDVAIATWWETALSLWEVEARQHVVFLQSLEQRFYRDWELFDRTGAAAVLGLPVHFVVVADWMQKLLGALRPDARCVRVRSGIDKAVFGTRQRRPPEASLRVLVEGNPALWFKAVPEAVAAARAMREQASITLVGLGGEESERLGVDTVESGLDVPGMAALYADHDVLVKLSRVEGLALPPLEAFHLGTPCIVSPYTGHDEYVRHGHNGLVVGFDDRGTVTAWLDRLARDRGLHERLSRGALATARDWPSLEQAGDAFCAAIEELAAGPPPRADGAAQQALADLQLYLLLGRHRARLAGWDQAALAEVRDKAEQLERQLWRITSSRPFRVANAARRLVRRSGR